MVLDEQNKGRVIINICLLFFLIKLVKKFGALCLVDHIAVVSLSSALNLVLLENLFFIFLSNDVPFSKDHAFVHEQHS